MFDRTVIVAFLLSLALVCLMAYYVHAEPATNPFVTQETLGQTVCVKGWTASVRPPYWTTQKLKDDMLHAAGYTWDAHAAFELDHVLPLCAGGAPLDASNLALQPIEEAKRKDRVEAVACRCLCAGKVTLDEIRADFKDWRVAYSKYAKMSCGRR